VVLLPIESEERGEIVSIASEITLSGGPVRTPASLHLRGRLPLTNRNSFSFALQFL
jgi:hypothetical protein